ncbi:MAG: OmpW/AlkL family protein [Gammaproteobacteria bacterium]
MKNLQIVIFLATMLSSMSSQAETNLLQEIFSEADEKWMIRVRAVYLSMSEGSDPISALGVPKDAIEIEDIFIPELDISYFFTKHIAAELVLTYPQKHKLHFQNSAIGPFKSGTFKHLPPTLMFQYHFFPDSWFRPYIGAGVNYTFFFDEKINVPGITPLRLETGSLGGAVQIGFDVKLSKISAQIPEGFFLNADLKKVWINSRVKAFGVTISNLYPDPLVAGVGIGYRF